MEFCSEEINEACFSLLLLGVLVEYVKQRRRGILVEEFEPKATPFTTITLVSNILITIFYLGFCFYEVWNHRALPLGSAFETLSWALVLVFALYSKNSVLREGKRWPSVLIFWWIFSTILSCFSISIYVAKQRFQSTRQLDFLPEANFADFATFPLSILLCFNAFTFRPAKKLHPLLQKENNDEEDSSPFASAGIWSKLTFKWMNPLFVIGRTRKLEFPDVPLVPDFETAEKSFSSLHESISIQEQEAFSLSTALLQSVWRPLAVNAAFAGLNTIASYMGPFLVTDFVNFLSEKHDDSSHTYGLFLAICFFLAKTIESLSQRQWYFGAQRIGIRIRAALMVSVYRKSLSFKYSGLNNGKIVNFINVDADKIGDFSLNIHGIWLLPLQVFLALGILCKNLGVWPAIAALLATMLVVFSNTPLAKKQKWLNTKIMEAKDSRIKATSETLKSMRILKLQAWETTYMKKILNLRATEKRWLKRYLYIQATIAFLFWTSPTLVSVVTFGVCISLKTPLTSGTVLSALATFRILQDPIYNLPELISMIAQTKVSVHRIQEFIKKEPKWSLPNAITNASNVAVRIGTGEYAWETSLPNAITNASNVAVKIGTGEYAWETVNPKSKKPVITLAEKIKIMKGNKVAVCGSVGSGKSSLLSSILGEIPRTAGAGTEVYGSKAYVPQSAWIQTGTIRENVLFGKEMEESFYKEVLEGCALNKDIEMWDGGDLSVVGERGINLSGGQKQRIQLARAIYNDADIYLLDDPFSAVDAHTGAHLFKECLMRLLSRKTVIFVTHQLDLLDASDLVLVVKDGRIVQTDKYEKLITDHDGEFFKQMVAHNESVRQVSPSQDSRLSTQAPYQVNQSEVTGEKLEKTNICGNPPGRIHEEETESGRVKWRVYSTFVTLAYKGYLVPVIIICQVLFQGLQIGSNYWIAWATEVEGRVSTDKLLGLFVLLSCGSSLFILGRAFFLSTVAIETAHKLFLAMINSVFRAPILFFDTTPSSQILNRSSTDQSTVDTDIPYRLAGLVFALIQLLSIIILMSCVAWPVFLLFILILAISIWYKTYYISTARELARMVAVKKSPILHHFSESIAGSVTIRSFNQEERFLTKVLDLINSYSRLVFHNSATMEWLSVRINFLFNLAFFVVLIVLVNLPRSAISPSLAGLAVTYGLNLNVLQAWVIWNLCNVENKMISVERILQFSNISSEAPLVIEDSRPEPEWPISGTIEIDNLHVRYSPSLPIVLKGITCKFQGKKKIGIVGRTGSGKSTLIQALFRVVEPSKGRILIDGVDICKMGLHDLRSKLGIIPQDPTLFQGTLRNNVDPLNQHSDPEIWEALSKCRLLEAVRKDGRLLDAPVAEDGKNWSVGQRQLVSLARVLLKKRRILVLDEATASVDTETDNLIQKTIREETNSCTVITVAHRIPTVIDTDFVLVIDEGEVVEYNTPTELLKDHSSAFSKLVMEFVNRSSRTS